MLSAPLSFRIVHEVAKSRKNYMRLPQGEPEGIDSI